VIWLLAAPARRAGIFIFALSLAVRVALVLLMHTDRELERTELINTAVSVSEGRGFANAYGADSGPTAHFAPLYPLLLSAVFRIAGSGPKAALAQQVIGYSVASAAYALLPAVAQVLELSTGVGISAGIAAALLPVNFWAERGTYPSVWAALFIALLLIYSGRVWRERRFNIKSALLGGLLAGIVMLTDPVVLTFMAALVAAGFAALRCSRLAYWCVLLVTPCVLLAPWVVRNSLVLGAPVWTRSNLGLELSISNSDGSAATVEENAQPGGIYSRRHPYSNLAELRRVSAMGEVAYNKDRMREFRLWIASHPGQFARLTSHRFLRFWFPVMLRPVQTIVSWFITLLGLLGLVEWLRGKPAMSALPLLLFLVYPLPYYIIQTSSRYRFPLEPIVLLFACSFVLSVIRPIHTARWTA
jgi:hypothetical protein